MNFILHMKKIEAPGSAINHMHHAKGSSFTVKYAVSSFLSQKDVKLTFWQARR